MKLTIKTKDNVSGSFFEPNKEYVLDLDKNLNDFPLKIEDASFMLKQEDGKYFLDLDWAMLVTIIYSEKTKEVFSKMKKVESIQSVLDGTSYSMDYFNLSVTYECGSREDAEAFKEKVYAKAFYQILVSSSIEEKGDHHEVTIFIPNFLNMEDIDERLSIVSAI